MTLREQLIRDEGGYQRFAYMDSLGYWTIGVGRNIDRRGGKGLSREEIDFLLDNDIRDFTADVLTALPWAANLDQARQDVLINMALNMGLKNLLGFRHTLAHIQAGEWDQAAREMLDSKWATQVGPRATRLARQMSTGVPQ